ncbi:uncharacterized protein LAJ45_10065 [Morchella importuna]|uniref:S-adenosyl-L-methionine-dependent methyltransferase n=1 Tax=Morchella conica CCBAS932 TaxID=1392247 RepID=A0A3N4KS55_9PEZI|nr:uncharacterized protein LAJ45_10065 [Morchella importuna]KAH8145923.1 hypothetical protein LAJ45_10065 [Morchella importuna]RPB12122.1 S-adenosyl-L-methionine-dependent methyltransferase [Morchella conica CCBAS932]
MGNTGNEKEPVIPVSNIEVDSGMYYQVGDDDEDQSSGNSQSECVSLTSSITDYPFEHGRRYHKYAEGQYFLPNDETEQDRLDMHHHIFLKLLYGKLTLAPLDQYPPRRVLDVGCGTGIWALDMAELYPEAEIVGIDLSPIQPNLVLPNCRFEIDDAELEWTYPPNHFDFIHSRMLSSSIRDWVHYMGQIYKHLTPGGHVEIIEHALELGCDDNSYPADCPLSIYMITWKKALDIMGLANMPVKAKEYLEGAGFIDITEEIRHMPVGPWPKDPHLKEIGHWALVNTETSFEAYGLALFTRVLGMSAESARELCLGAQRDCGNRHIHVYLSNFFYLARKPYDINVDHPGGM